MSDTKILDKVLDMLAINETADWGDGRVNDPVHEFRQLGMFIRDGRANEEADFQRQYATCAWEPGDIQSLRPAWSLEKCDTWLQANKRQIQNDTTERGWSSIETLLEMTEEEGG